jgi:hypothetical protein
MKRLIVVLCVVGFIVALPMSHLASAAKPQTKVAICHVNSANDVLYLEDGNVVTFGRVIVISENAVATHVAQHGDSTEYADLDKATRDAVEDYYGIRLPNANCYFPGVDLFPPELLE